MLILRVLLLNTIMLNIRLCTDYGYVILKETNNNNYTVPLIFCKNQDRDYEQCRII